MRSSIPPLPISPLGPFSMNSPVSVMISRHTAVTMDSSYYVFELPQSEGGYREQDDRKISMDALCCPHAFLHFAD